MVTLAALIGYGLLSDQGSGDARTVQLTPLAQQALFAEDIEERRTAIAAAALLPPAHQALWERYAASLPSDQTIQLYLQQNGFTPGGAKELAAEWRRTLTFSGLSSDRATVSPTEPKPAQAIPVQEVSAAVTPPTVEAAPSRARTSAPPPIQIRVGSSTVTLQESEPLTSGQWSRMLEILRMMAPQPDEG